MTYLSATDASTGTAKVVYESKDKTTSKSYIEATTRAELLRITKTNLMKICKKYPNVELRLIDLYKIRKKSANGGAEQKRSAEP